MQELPPARIRAANDAPRRPGRAFVLYWMTASRRTRSNFALQRAVGLARELDRPLVVLEALRCDYPWASDRIHRFVLDGMGDNAARFARTPALYHPYVEPRQGAGRGLLAALARDACTIVTDDFPCFFLPRMLAAAAREVDTAVETVDGNGLLPMRSADRVFTTAYSFRRFLQKTLADHLLAFPEEEPLRALPAGPRVRLPAQVARRWPANPDAALHALPIDHGVAAGPREGGATAARRTLRRFLESRLDDYADRRNEPEADATSGLSAYLHFGHVSPHAIFAALADREGWTPGDLAPTATGRRTGWWGMSTSAEAFLDQLVTWRELGYNGCCHPPGHDTLAALPAWAQATLAKHAADVREHVYDLGALDAGATHDPLWNAAQTQLRREGRIHNYLRMLWGKKILEWSATPEEALAAMIELNNRYALDGRDPNSYSGILWVLGRYDRAWGPERPVFGTVRYMSSENTARKVRVKEYIARYA